MCVFLTCVKTYTKTFAHRSALIMIDYSVCQMSREQLAVQRARKSFQTGKTKPLEFRIHQLRCLLRFISERRSDIAAAVKEDLGKVGL